MIVTILLVFVFFVLSCFFPTQPPGGSRYNLLSIGLAAWVLSEIFQRSGLLGR